MSENELTWTDDAEPRVTDRPFMLAANETIGSQLWPPREPSELTDAVAVSALPLVLDLPRRRYLLGLASVIDPHEWSDLLDVTAEGQRLADRNGRPVLVYVRDGSGGDQRDRLLKIMSPTPPPTLADAEWGEVYEGGGFWVWKDRYGVTLVREPGGHIRKSTTANPHDHSLARHKKLGHIDKILTPIGELLWTVVAEGLPRMGEPVLAGNNVWLITAHCDNGVWRSITTGAPLSGVTKWTRLKELQSLPYTAAVVSPAIPPQSGPAQPSLDAAPASLADLHRVVAELTEWKELALSALGEHPDTELDIAQRISDIRDEGRAYFHELTKIGKEVNELRDERDRLAVSLGQFMEAAEAVRVKGTKGATDAAD